MKKFKSIFAKIGIALAIPALLTIQPTESPAQKYSYKIIRYSTTTPIPGGHMITDFCTHGPGLCGPTSPQQ